MRLENKESNEEVKTGKKVSGLNIRIGKVVKVEMHKDV